MSTPFEPDFDLHRTLLQLLDQPPGLAHLEHATEYAINKLLTTPARRLNPADLHFLLQHGVALPYTVPLAIAKLEDDPFLQAERYPGDLLILVLETDATFWQDRVDLWCAMIPVLETAVTRINTHAAAEDREDYLPDFLGDDFMAALMHFRSIHAGE
ncbi:MAG: hypothetical protein IT368_10260 [Candidatus Hydrogenedentes bacterium]|nr:hypothetical protein [Candidatus Hydrogenedentota bacterium]